MPDKETPKVGFVSLGCPKNLVDSEVMLGALSRHGYTITANKEDADVIVRKLEAKAVSKPGAPHYQYAVSVGSRIVRRFGVRHSSKKDKGHDHLPKALGVSMHFCKGISSCDNYKNDYLREIGELDDQEDNAE